MLCILFFFKEAAYAKIKKYIEFSTKFCYNSTSDRVYDKEVNKLSGEIVDLHFIIEKDGSGLTMHFKAPEKGSTTQSFKLTKEA